MNKFIVIVCYLLLLFAFDSSYSQSRKRAAANADLNTSQWRYDAICYGSGGANDTYLILVSTYVQNLGLALEQSRKNAIHAVLFKGIVGNNEGCEDKDPIISPEIEIAQNQYFEDFFKYTNYSKFTTTPTGVPSEIIELDRRGRNLRVDYVISVDVNNLRAQLEFDKVLEPLGFGEISGIKPVISIFPSDGWCKRNGYWLTFENQGQVVGVPDYQNALLDGDLATAIANLEDLIQERGYPIKSLAAELSSLKQSASLDALNSSREGGASTEVSVLDELLSQAKVDISWEVEWTVDNNGFEKKLNYTIRAIDVYTNEAFSSESGTGPNSVSAGIPELLKQSVTDKMDAFLGKHQTYFNEIVENGRKVSMEFRRWDDFDLYFDDLVTVRGQEFTITEILQQFLRANAISSSFQTNGTNTQINVTDLRIPLNRKERNIFTGETELVPIATAEFARKLQTFLKNEMNIESSLLSLGLGKVRLTLGSK